MSKSKLECLSSETGTHKIHNTVDFVGTMKLGGVTMTSTTLAADVVPAVAGTVEASKVVLLGANKNIDTIAIADGGLKLGAGAGTAVGATAAELNIAADASAQTETIDASGVVAATKRITKIAGTGAGAVTLAAPDATMIGLVKIIEMTAANGAITLALTNVQGGSAATTASFDAVNETLVLIGGTNKWTVLKEVGVTLS